MRKNSKKLKVVLLLLNVIFLLMVVLSYGEVVVKNGSPNPQYSNWNLMAKMVESYK